MEQQTQTLIKELIQTGMNSELANSIFYTNEITIITKDKNIYKIEIMGDKNDRNRL